MIALPIGLIDAIQSTGMVAPVGVRDVGKMTRFDAKNGKLGSQYAGYVTLFADLEGAVFGNWTTGFESVWQDKDKRKMSESERINFDAMIKASKQKALTEKEAAQKAAADLASDRYNKAAVNSGSESKYLLRKFFDKSNYAVKVDENQALILPIRDLVTGSISSLQTIQDDGTKRFMSGGSVKGMGLILNNLSTVDCFTLSDLKGLPRVVVVEGFVTGATVRDALDCPVVVAFSSGNIPVVAALIRTHLPDIEIVVCADIGNGQDKAEQAAKLVKGLIVLPTGKDGTDFNDDFVAGLNAGLSRDDSLAAIRERIESQINSDSLPDFVKAAMGIDVVIPSHSATVMTSLVPPNPVAMINDVPHQVYCVCEDKTAADMMTEFVNYKRVFVESDKYGLTLKSIMKTCKVSDGKLEVEAGIYWLAIGHSDAWLNASYELGMMCHNSESLQYSALNDGLKAVSMAVNKALPIGVAKVAMRPKFVDFSRKGAPLNTLENWDKLTKWEGVKLSYNEMTRKIEFRANWLNNIGSSDVVETNNLSQLISAGKRQELNESMVVDYLLTLASARAYHPVRDWIENTPWDGVSRIAEFCNTLVTDDEKIKPELKMMLISHWAVGAVQAALSDAPSAQHGVLVLTGAQGAGKTRWIRALCPDSSVNGAVKDGLMLDAKTPDSVRLATEQWISELGELDGTFRKSDIANLKAFITSDADSYRMPYARSSNRYPRRTAFVASVNENNYLVDDTGNRRFWTIPVESVDYEHTVNIQQVWAEYTHHWRDGAKWYLTGKDIEALNSHNNEFEAVDPYAELVGRRFCFDQVYPFSKKMTATDVALACGYSQVDKKTAMAFSRALGKIKGIKKTKLERVNGVSGRFWIMPDIC